MISVIQCQAAGHFRRATDTATIYTKLTEWYGLDYDKRIDILALDHEITAFACLSNSYLTIVKGVNMSQDSTESRRKLVLGCFGEAYDFNICLVPAKNLVLDFVL